MTREAPGAPRRVRPIAAVALVTGLCAMALPTLIVLLLVMMRATGGVPKPIASAIVPAMAVCGVLGLAAVVLGVIVAARGERQSDGSLRMGLAGAVTGLIGSSAAFAVGFLLVLIRQLDDL